MKLGYIPPMTKGLTLDRDYVIRLVEMLEQQNVESVWTVEHVIMANPTKVFHKLVAGNCVGQVWYGSNAE